MERTDLLPGVQDAPPARPILCDARAAIERARRAAFARDVALITMLLAVDYLFIGFQSTRFPLIDRASSVAIMRVVNLAVFAQIWLARMLPKWRAQRIAGTWCAHEKKRFLAATRSRFRY